MHELLRQYALELLAESQDGGMIHHKKHAVYYGSLVKEQTASLKGGEQQQASDLIRAEMNNISKMWDWSVRNGFYEAVDMALEGIWVYFCRFFYPEPGERMLRAAVESLRNNRSSENDGLYPRCLLRWVWLIRVLGKDEKIRQLVEEAMDLARESGNEYEVGLCFELRAALAWPDRDEMIKDLKKAEEAFLYTGDDWRRVFILLQFASIAMENEGYAAAAVFAEKARVLSRSIGDRISEAVSLMTLAWNASWTLGDLEKAKELRTEAHRLRQGFNKWVALGALFGLHWDEYALGNLDQAESHAVRVLEYARELGVKRSISMFQSNLCFTYMSGGKFEQAKECGHEAYELAMEIDDAYWGAQATAGLAWTAYELGDTDKAVQWAQRTLELWDSMDKTGIEYQPVAIGSIVLLAAISAQNGDFDRAREKLAYVLDITARRGHIDDIAACIVAYAEILFYEGKVEWALELLSFVNAYRGVWYETRMRAMRLSESLKSRLSQKQYQEAIERGKMRSMEATISELSEELGISQG